MGYLFLHHAKKSTAVKMSVFWDVAPCSSVDVLPTISQKVKRFIVAAVRTSNSTQLSVNWWELLINYRALAMYYFLCPSHSADNSPLQPHFAAREYWLLLASVLRFRTIWSSRLQEPVTSMTLQRIYTYTMVIKRSFLFLLMVYIYNYNFYSTFLILKPASRPMRYPCNLCVCIFPPPPH
jgi:hypothetical protein